MRGAVLFVALPVCLSSTLAAENWPEWRGPNGNGVSGERAVPVRWCPEEGIAWKAPLGGLGVSSPVVWGDRVFVTSQIGRGRLREGSHPTAARGEGMPEELPLGGERADPDGGKVDFLVEAYDRSDGQRLWGHRFEAEGAFPELHQKHNMASPSPVTDGEHVYAWFATGQLVALDMAGRLAWQRHFGKDSPFDIRWGHGSSPRLYQELLILQCQRQSASYVVALDKRTGEQRWRGDRDPGVESYSTPLLVRWRERDELIVNSSQRVEGLDPATGELLWWAGEPRRYGVPSPAYDQGVLYMSRGIRSGPYLSLRVGGRGDVSKTHVSWRVPTGAPYASSLVYYAGLVYMANGNGIVSCIDGQTGELVWRERIGGVYTASPVAADGRVYLLNEGGEMVVLHAGREPVVLERNRVDGRTVASPAISNGQLFIRTDTHLICIGDGGTQARQSSS